MELVNIEMRVLFNFLQNILVKHNFFIVNFQSKLFLFS